MAVMGRKKKAVAAGWNAINKQRDEESKKLQEKAKKEDTPEERAEKERILREAGLLK